MEAILTVLYCNRRANKTDNYAGLFLSRFLYMPASTLNIAPSSFTAKRSFTHYSVQCGVAKKSKVGTLNQNFRKRHLGPEVVTNRLGAEKESLDRGIEVVLLEELLQLRILWGDVPPLTPDATSHVAEYDSSRRSCGRRKISWYAIQGLLQTQRTCLVSGPDEGE